MLPAERNDSVESTSVSEAGSADGNDQNEPDDSQPVATSQATSTTAAQPVTIDDAELAELVTLQSGEEVQDAQGNVIAIYGVSVWPSSYKGLSGESRSTMRIFGDAASTPGREGDLVLLDVGMCAAGIDVSADASIEFSAAESMRAELEPDPGRQLVATHHPIVTPGFYFPEPAACHRGWLPLLWAGDEAPTTARYLLSSRGSASDAIEQYLYQWDLEVAGIDEPSDVFGAGQTVTFNDGPLAGTTVVVDGWAELLNVSPTIEGLRMVGVSLTVCPSGGSWPDFGVAVDGWNLIEVAGPGVDELASQAEAEQGCFAGWLQFGVPLGGVPTGFFASDGVDPVRGFAQWSLVGAAIAPPQ